MGCQWFIREGPTAWKQLRRQYIAVVNTVVTIGGVFAFFYKAVEYSLPEPNVAAQVRQFDVVWYTRYRLTAGPLKETTGARDMERNIEEGYYLLKPIQITIPGTGGCSCLRCRICGGALLSAAITVMISTSGRSSIMAFQRTDCEASSSHRIDINYFDSFPIVAPLNENLPEI